MKLYKKISLIAVLLFIIFTFTIALIGPKLINTDKIKTKITQGIRDKYNYEVEIDSLHIFLFLGVKARMDGIEARSLAKAKYRFDAKAEALEASIKLVPLFRRKVEIERLSIRNGKIKVESETLLTQRIASLELSEINLTALPIELNRPIRIRLRSKLALKEREGEPFFLRPIDISLDEKIKIDKKKITVEDLRIGIESIAISLAGSLSNIEEPLVEARLSIREADLNSLNNFLNFGKGKGPAGTLNFNGTLSGYLNKYSVDNLKGTLELKEAEFKGLFPNTVLKLNGKLDIVSSSILKELLSGNFDNAEIKGKLSVPNGRFNKIVFQDLSSDLNYKKNIMDLAPVGFSLYDGSFKGNIRVAPGEAPDFNLKAEVKDISVEKFLADTSTMKDTIYGRLESYVEVEGKGKDLSMITQTMTGNMHVEMRDGKITTLNLLTAILSAAGLSPIVRPHEGNYTPIDLLTADVVIGEGKAATDNLHLISKRLEVVGKGYVSFDQELHFIMDAYLGTPKEGFKGSGKFIERFMKDKFGRLVIPIKITGTVRNYRPYLDLERLAKDILKEQVLEELLPKIFK